jgi:AcrR family transcriptional regulator
LSTPELTIAPRRLRADAVRNREKVLDAARAAFAEHGAEAQMEDVARRAGVGVGTVYRHFPTKQALASALVEERFERVIAHARGLLDEPDPWRAIERCFEYCATTQEQDRAYAGVLASMAGAGAVAGTDPNDPARGPGAAAPVAGPREHQRAELLSITAQLLERARAAGAIRDDLRATDLPPLFCGLASVVQAGVTDWRRYLELLLDGLRPRAAAR